MKQPIKKHRAEANGINTEPIFYSLVIDGNNLLKISLVDKTMNSKGEEYGAVMSFVRILGGILNKKDFNYCMVCWDGIGSGVLRWKLYEDYKANRGKNYFLHDPNMSEYDRKLLEYQSKVIAYSKAKRGIKEDKSEEETFEREKTLIPLD